MIKYEGSELWKNIEYNNDIEQLYNMSRYIDGAVIYHKTTGDKDNEEFFTAASDHWKTKIQITIRKSEPVDKPINQTELFA